MTMNVFTKLSFGSDGACWEVAAGGRPPIAWDPDVAAECERSTLLSAPRPPPAVPERQRVADAAAAAELRRLAGEGRLAAALRAAAALTAAGTPPPFPTLALLAEEAARRADPAAFERARRLAARLYPLNYGRAARLRGPQLELLWRRRLFAPACGLLLRYRSEPVRRQQMARRFAVCCCLAAHEGAEDALPYIQSPSDLHLLASIPQSTSVALMSRGLSGPLLSAWQHCTLSDQHSFQEAGRRLLLAQPAARRHLAPYLLHALQEAQLTGREDVLRGLLELMLRLGETRFYPLVFGALLDFQCLMEDVQSARETFKLVGELSISLPSTVINRYSSLLQRHRLKAPAALLRMKYRQRPPDGSSAAAPKVPPAPSWFDDW
ncbi:hypothetical protein FJT64_018011 [Amphibalanus amphitrite]|uniref:Uncharacterized protein n=1 Tax=Amphibalanus amphitrite TaxID=1232801 RepID=A0A6A4WW77_AMPAM|nr:hypothetical protein FJT64_018011 [Amphibalanus amphitrite]